MKRLVATIVILILTCFLLAGCDIVDSAIDGVNSSKHDINNAIIGLFSHTHNYAENIVTPTCENQGYTTFTCECGDIYVGNYVSALGHTEVVDAAVPATCTITGLTKGKHCSRCNEVIVAQQTVAMVDHDYVNYICMDCGSTGYSQGLKYTLGYDGDYYIVTGIGTYKGRNLSIPAEHNGLPVKGIASNAFEDQTQLVSITIPETIIDFGSYTFNGCTNVTTLYYNAIHANPMGDSGSSYKVFGGLGHDTAGVTVYIGPNVEKIPARMLSIFMSGINVESNNITSIVFDEHSKCTEIGLGAFDECALLVEISLPNSVTSIGDWAFYGCSSLANVTIPDGVTSIGDRAFYGCSSLANVTIPDCVISIGEYAFRGCTSLVSVIIGNGVTSIGNSAFSGCTSLTGVTIPDSVTSIGSSPFRDCTSLTSIDVDSDNAYYKSIDGNLYTKDGKEFVQYANGKTDTTFMIPDGVTSIGEDAFSGCKNLTNVTIPDSITSIGDWAFYNCSNLASITIPDSVTSIGYYAFYDCSSLTTIYYAGTSSDWNEIKINKNGNSYLIGATRYYYSETMPTEEGNFWLWVDGVPVSWDVYNDLGYSVGLEYTSNGDGTCYVSGIGTCTDTDIVIPTVSPDGETVIGIGNSAFYDCSSLTSVTIPDGVTYIGRSAFYFCTSLESIIIPDSVTNIGRYALYIHPNFPTINYRGTEAQWKEIEMDVADTIGDCTVVYNYTGE